MHITIGNVVRSNEFFDREELVRSIWLTLETDSVLLAAPRRVGKTSIMFRLLDRPAKGWKVVLLDAQTFSTCEDLVAELVIKLSRMHSNRRGFLRKLFADFKETIAEMEIWKLRIKLREKLKGRWRDDGEAALLDAASGADRLLLIVDELPVMLHKMMQCEASAREAQGLLDWLRFLRLHPDLNTGLRMLVGGSIGLPRIASYLGSSHKINDLLQTEVGPFGRETARDLVRELLASRGIELGTEVMEAFLDQVGTFVPIFLQILAACVANEIRERKAEPTPELVRECYNTRAMGPEYRLSFEDYFERLSRYYTAKEAQAARRVLRELAVATDPVPCNALLAAYFDELGDDADQSRFELLLTWLRDDFYVDHDPETDEVTFKSTWLRDWWRHHHARIV